MYVEHEESLMFVWFFAVVFSRGSATFSLSLGNLFLWVCICGNLGYWRSGFLGTSWIWSSIWEWKSCASWLAEDPVKTRNANWGLLPKLGTLSKRGTRFAEVPPEGAFLQETGWDLVGTRPLRLSQRWPRLTLPIDGMRLLVELRPLPIFCYKAR